jgi:hypothetical protein
MKNVRARAPLTGFFERASHCRASSPRVPEGFAIVDRLSGTRASLLSAMLRRGRRTPDIENIPAGAPVTTVFALRWNRRASSEVPESTFATLDKLSGPRASLLSAMLRRGRSRRDTNHVHGRIPAHSVFEFAMHCRASSEVPESLCVCGFDTLDRLSGGRASLLSAMQRRGRSRHDMKNVLGRGSLTGVFNLGDHCRASSYPPESSS